MKFLVNSGPLQGRVDVPSSKSHTIRAVFIAALADGVSTITNPLDSADGRSSVAAATAMGADVKISKGAWQINGTGGAVSASDVPINVGNSGTTARFAISMASLANGPITITGDEQTRSRPMGPLLEALANLGVKTKSANGKLPATLHGPLTGGKTNVDGVTSQYLSSLLIHAPLASGDTVLTLESLNEKPYVEMTLRWLDKMGIRYERDGYKTFMVRGGQSYPSFEERIPGDFSSATFFACMGAVPGAKIVLNGLDMDDVQGDKAIFEYLVKMGAKVNVDGSTRSVTVTGDTLKGVDLDLNSTPDALPALAALACLAEGKTTLGNVPQARIKETDRIAVMAEELGKMGIRCEELPDGLIVYGGKPKGAKVSGHGDHRVVMSLAFLASAAEGTTQIDTAEAVEITFPDFAERFAECGGKITIEN